MVWCVGLRVIEPYIGASQSIRQLGFASARYQFYLVNRLKSARPVCWLFPFSVRMRRPENKFDGAIPLAISCCEGTRIGGSKLLGAEMSGDVGIDPIAVMPAK